MIIPEQGILLRIFIGEKDHHHGKPLHEALIELARKKKMAGATALKGFMGFGAKSHLHTTKLLRLSEDLPIIIELVDSEEKINGFLPELDHMISDGLVTMEKAKVVIYRGQKT